MGKKFNGVFENKLRWYDTESGDIQEVLYNYDTRSEVEFSRTILKTNKMTMSIHPDHKPAHDGFWWYGYQADENQRITFQTETKNRIVISKNEVDFLFCSTNQSFRSCFSLYSGGPYQLRELHKTPGIYIAYVTQENGTHTYDGVEYVHPKMSGRSFVFMAPNGVDVCVGRPYGKNGFELRDAIKRFVPNGISVGWELSDAQKGVTNIEYDNFTDSLARHDKYDAVFDKSLLYDDTPVVEIIKE